MDDLDDRIESFLRLIGANVTPLIKQRVEQFLRAEMDAAKPEFVLSRAALSEIKQQAIQQWLELNFSKYTVEGQLIHKDDDLIRTVCFVKAVVMFLNREGYLKGWVTIK